MSDVDRLRRTVVTLWVVSLIGLLVALAVVSEHREDRRHDRDRDHQIDCATAAFQNRYRPDCP